MTFSSFPTPMIMALGLYLETNLAVLPEDVKQIISLAYISRLNWTADAHMASMSSTS